MNGKEKNKELAAVRRANLQRFVDLHYGGNASALARKYGDHMKKHPRPSFFSELLGGVVRTSFGPVLATDIELAVDLQEGQLSIPNSPLHMKAAKPKLLSQEIAPDVDRFDVEQQRQLLKAIEEIRQQKPKPKRRIAR